MSNSLQTRVTKDQMVAYATDVLLNGATKKDAYLRNVKEVSQVHIAISRLEKTEEYQAIYNSIMSDDAAKMAVKVRRVQDKYLGLMEKNIDTASGILDEANSFQGEGAIQTRATAVRLVNETVGAMAVVTGTSQPQKPGELNKSSVVLGN